MMARERKMRDYVNEREERGLVKLQRWRERDERPCHVNERENLIFRIKY